MKHCACYTRSRSATALALAAQTKLLLSVWISYRGHSCVWTAKRLKRASRWLRPTKSNGCRADTVDLNHKKEGEDFDLRPLCFQRQTLRNSVSTVSLPSGRLVTL